MCILWAPTHPKLILGIRLRSDHTFYVIEFWHSGLKPPSHQTPLGGLETGLEKKDSTGVTVAGGGENCPVG